MGASASQPKVPLVSRIMESVEALLSEYQRWTDLEELADLVLVYKDSLHDFHPQEVQETAMMLGIQVSSEERESAVEQIIRHYQRRLKMMQRINYGLIEAQNMIHQATEGGVCYGIEGYVEDFFQCQKVSGFWFDPEAYQKAVEQIRKDGRYASWEHALDSLEDRYQKYLIRVEKVVRHLRKRDGVIPEDELKELEQEVNQTMRKMKLVMQTAYLVVVHSLPAPIENTPST